MAADRETGFEAFVASHGLALAKLARLLTRSREEAEDLMQVTLERVYVRWHRVSSADDPLAYVRRMVAHAATDAARSRRRRPTAALFDGAADVTDPSLHVAGLVAGGRRRLRRRRSASGLAALLVLVVATTAGGALVRHHGDQPALVAAPTASASPGVVTPSRSPGAVPSESGTPSVTPTLPGTRALDLLAPLTQPVLVVDQDGLGYLSGRVRTEVSGTRGASSPGISYDGNYLSWLTASGQRLDLHIRDRRNNAETVTRDITSYAWSPTSDVMAECSATSLAVTTPTFPPKIMATGACNFPAFSPDGTRLAVGVGRVTLVYRLDASGDPLGSALTLPYSLGTPRFVGNGLLLWPDPSFSSSIAADGLTLTDINLRTLQAFPLTNTLTYADWIQPLPTPGEYVVVAGDDREAHDNKVPRVFVIPDEPTAANPPRLAAQESVTIPEKTSLLSIAVSLPEGTISTVTGPDDANLEGNTVDGTLGEQRDDLLTQLNGFPPVAAVANTSNGKVAGAFAITATELYLEDASGSYDLGPIGPATDELPAYYSHVNPADVLAVPAGS